MIRLTGFAKVNKTKETLSAEERRSCALCTSADDTKLANSDHMPTPLVPRPDRKPYRKCKQSVRQSQQLLDIPTLISPSVQPQTSCSSLNHLTPPGNRVLYFAPTRSSYCSDLPDRDQGHRPHHTHRRAMSDSTPR